MTEVAVESSNISSVSYSEGDFFVNFKSGIRYRYLEVPVEKYNAFLQAESKGRYLNAEIKGQHTFERLG